ncbi:MAG: hypothetical protein ACTSWN_01865 [Promethearchaeota archaeon]
MVLSIETKIYPTEIKTIPSGFINAKYTLQDITYSNLDVVYIDGLSKEMHFIDRDERDDEPRHVGLPI